MHWVTIQTTVLSYFDSIFCWSLISKCWWTHSRCELCRTVGMKRRNKIFNIRTQYYLNGRKSNAEIYLIYIFEPRKFKDLNTHDSTKTRSFSNDQEKHMSKSTSGQEGGKKILASEKKGLTLFLPTSQTKSPTKKPYSPPTIQSYFQPNKTGNLFHLRTNQDIPPPTLS